MTRFTQMLLLFVLVVGFNWGSANPLETNPSESNPTEASPNDGNPTESGTTNEVEEPPASNKQANGGTGGTGGETNYVDFAGELVQNLQNIGNIFEDAGAALETQIKDGSMRSVDQNTYESILQQIREAKENWIIKALDDMLNLVHAMDRYYVIQYVRIFSLTDQNHDRYLGMEEIIKLINPNGYLDSQTVLRKLNFFMFQDRSKDGRVSLTEFVRASLVTRFHEKIRNYDWISVEDEKIDLEELKAMAPDLPEFELHALLAAVDRNKDGTVWVQEFANALADMIFNIQKSKKTS